MNRPHAYLPEEQRYFEVNHLTQMQELGCTVQKELGVTTAEEFVAWLTELKANVSALREIGDR